ncbi:MAG TPA: ACP S-malonyltransferase [Bacillota bacterium]|nr:ACP S-malonyltransferase [Bacillota bacterium]
MVRPAAVAVLFPGQGSQHVGMGVELAAARPEAREAWDRVSEAVGRNLLRLVADGPEDELTRTVNAQPALLAAGLAVVAALRRHWWAPLVGAGLSLGEYTALVASGTLDLEETARLVRLRGSLMEDAVPRGVGSMAAIIGLDRKTVADICGEASGSEVVEPANYNSPGQIVVSGHDGAVERAMKLARAAGARKVVKLAVSGPFHSRLMQPAGARLAEALDRIAVRPGAFPVVANSTATVPDDPASLRRSLARQVSAPVLWEDGLTRMQAMGARLFLELGPGTSLAGMVARSLEGVRVHSAGDLQSLEVALAKLEEGC